MDVDKLADKELENYAYMLGMNVQDSSDFRGLMLEVQQEKGQEDGSLREENGKMTAGLIGKNTISKRNGLPDEEGLHTISGWEKPFKGRQMRHCIQKLNQFHKMMNVQVGLSDMNAVKDVGRAYQELLNEVTKFVNGAQKGKSWFHGKEEAAMLPAMSSLLIQLYSMGNVFEKSEWIVYDYIMEHKLNNVRLGLALTGRLGQSMQGNMVSTGIEEGQIDRTALQMKKGQENQAGEHSDDFLNELNQRRMPALGDKNALEQLQRIATMLEDIELQAKNDVERVSVRADYFDITKMIHLLVNHPELISEHGAKRLAEEEQWSAHEKQDFWNTSQYYKEIAGKTVTEAVEIINKIRIEQAETAATNSITKGGQLSTVLIDTEKKRVLRTTQEENETLEEQRHKNNFNYDEAMSRLGEVTGLGSQAGARTTYFKDLEGNLQYGTNMDLAKGESARKGVNLSFGLKQADKMMGEGRYNVFGYGTSKELEKNAGLIISSFKMQILDYIAFHTDRHADNFFIDWDAENMENAFKGIDNDNVFGNSPGGSKIENRALGYKKQATGGERNDKADYVDNASTLIGFQCIPVETARAIQSLNEEQINKAMLPYLDRASRFALGRRIRQLKDYAATAEIVDVKTEKGMEAFRQKTMKMMLKTVVENIDTNNLDVSIKLRSSPAVLVRVLMEHYFSSSRFDKKEAEKIRRNTFDSIMREVYKNEFHKSEEDMKFIDMKTIRSVIFEMYAPDKIDKKDKEKFIDGTLRMDWH